MQTLTIAEMEQFACQYPRQAECLFDIWLYLRRVSAESHARRKSAAIAEAEAHLLDTMQAVRPGAIVPVGVRPGGVPDHPQTLAQTLALAEVGARRCGAGGGEYE
jgi:hypothetical protein